MRRYISFIVICIVLSGLVKGLPVRTYYEGFSSGISLQLWVWEGNASIDMAWDGNALYLYMENGTARLDIYNVDEHGNKIFEYSNIRKIHYEFWIIATDEVTGYIEFGIGSLIGENRVEGNIFKVQFDVVPQTSNYSSLLVKSLIIIYASAEGTQNLTTIFSTDTLISGKFILDINLYSYPKSIQFGFTYPIDDTGNTEYLPLILENPSQIGKVSVEPKVGINPSPIYIYSSMSNPYSNPVQAGLILDNVNIDYLGYGTQVGFPVYYLIGLGFAVAVPILAYEYAKKKRGQGGI